ncbi:MAG: RNA polymerase sigma factor [Isosphaeraceae bacterium]
MFTRVEPWIRVRKTGKRSCDGLRPRAFDAAWRLLGHAADTEDVVREVLVDAFRLHARQKVANWGALRRHLSTRRAIDRLRKRGSVTLLPLGAFEFSAPDSEQPESVAAERELADRLRWAIAELPDREASVFSLRYFGEIAHGQRRDRPGAGHQRCRRHSGRRSVFASSKSANPPRRMRYSGPCKGPTRVNGCPSR